MPHSSDSEAFESADEDINLAEQPNVKNAPTKIVKETEAHLVPVKEQVEPNRFPISGRSSPVEQRDHVFGDLFNVNQLKKTEEKLIKVRENMDSNHHHEMKSKVKTVDSAEVQNQTPKPAVHNPNKTVIDNISTRSLKNVEDETTETTGWDIDDWGDDEKTVTTSVETKTTKPVVESKTSNTVDPKQPDTKHSEVEEVGWDVDDWDDEPIEDKQFPNQLNTRSQTSEIASTASKELLDNLSQMHITSSHNVAVDQKNNAPSVRNPLDRLVESSESSSNWGWKPWGGVVNLLSTATDGVASITSHVSSVIESGIGVPDPSELARIQQVERQNMQKQQSGDVTTKAESSTPVGGSNATIKRESSRGDDASLFLGQFMSGMTQISNRVITGGLDTLEGIGKKTMTILKENDQGLLQKQRKMMMLDGHQGPILSQILREAKEKTEEAERNLQLVQKQQYKKQLHFETLFDDYHGLVHLEALEMLSRQSALKLQSFIAPLSGRALDDIQETMDEVKELCELNDSDSDESDGMHSVEMLQQKIKEALEDLDVQIDFQELLDCWKSSIEWLEEKTLREPQAIHDKSLRCLAETTANAVHKLHKLAELLLIKERHNTANEADTLVQLTTCFCWHLSGIAARFGAALSQLNNEEETNSLITSTFLEGSNSISYIQNAFQLFIPILQIGAA